MAKIIVNATHKGGEGKTTVSIHLAEYASLVSKQRVLGIDLDPQANFSSRYIQMEYDPVEKGGKIPTLHPDYDPKIDDIESGRSSIADIFYGKSVIPYPTMISCLDLLPASYKLKEAETTTANEVVEKIYQRLTQFLHQPSLNKAYDIIIIDTPTALGPLTNAAIKAASHVIIPAQLELFSIQGIYAMLQILKQESYVRHKNTPINLVGILPNQVKNTNLHTQILEDLKTMDGIESYVMPHSIKHRIIYPEVLMDNNNLNSIFKLSASHVARQECEAVFKYIMEKVLS